MQHPTYALDGIQDGYYGVADPDDAGRLTLWEVRAGIPRDWPQGTRWRPWPPSFTHLDRPARDEARDAWYRDVYYPWREQVSAAIAADPEAARAAFVEAAGHQELPPRRRKPTRATKGTPRGGGKRATEAARRRDEVALLAAALHSGGRSWRAVAALLALPKTSVHRLAADHGPVDVPEAAIAALALARAHDLTEQLQQMRQAADPATRRTLDVRINALARLRHELAERAGAAGAR
ncbi:hypothetical protein GA0070616_1341 [Micromonospora nigra]|uniref:Uncharacterized protein n=1 Tax=Micromonospora nigra TaxID=145857 RepID=A0A1C6RKL2_9ACTN|nr:hypothetical protein [Micromonospora nigra]SCL17712.1 hypothetical protein GA0070616_1341 [Micromonospora nigra]